MKAFLIGSTIGWISFTSVSLASGTANLGTLIPGIFVMLGWSIYFARSAAKNGGAA